jgi:hypothetical protein
MRSLAAERVHKSSDDGKEHAGLLSIRMTSLLRLCGAAIGTAGPAVAGPERPTDVILRWVRVGQWPKPREGHPVLVTGRMDRPVVRR